MHTEIRPVEKTKIGPSTLPSTWTRIMVNALARGPGGVDIVHMPHLRGDAFGDTRHLRHEHQGQREQRVTDARPQRAGERDRQQHRGKA